MNKTVLAIIELVAKMDEAQQAQTFTQLQAIVSSKPAQSADEWLARLESVRKHNEATYGVPPVSSIELLREAREERLNDIMGGS